MEKGTVQILNKRWKKTLPDCSVDRGVALGPEKLVSLFTVLCMGFFLATICFAFEVTFRGSDKSKLPDDDCGDKTEKRMWNKCTEREQLSRRYQTIMSKEFQSDKKLEFIHELEQFLLELKRQQKAKESR